MIKVSFNTMQFDKALDEYMKFTKRSVSDVINAKCWFIARGAVNATEKADRTDIESELSAPSRDYAPAPLAAIIINSRRGKKQEKGLSGRAMAKAIQTMKNARFKSINFLRAGWIPAVKILEQALKRGDISFSKRYAPKMDTGVKKKGVDKGSAIWAKYDRERTFGEIENFVQGGKTPSDRVHTIIMRGLQKSITAEIASMRTYIEKKMNPAADKFNR